MKNKSFTLIELLVVIAIIGLLASIILVSFKGAREKAKIAESLKFSQSIQHALGLEAVGIWSFDDCPGGTANDASGYGNNGTIYDASCTDDTPHKIVGSGQGKHALRFDGENDYVDCGSDASLDNLNQFTYEAWIYRIGSGISQMILSKSAYIRLYVNSENRLGGFVQGITVGGGSAASSISVETIPQNTWVHVAMHHDDTGDRKVYLFLNGKEVSYSVRWAMPTDYWLPDNSNKAQWVGRVDILDYYFNGAIDEVRIYAEALSSAEIQKHYAEGLKRHQLIQK